MIQFKEDGVTDWTMSPSNTSTPQNVTIMRQGLERGNYGNEVVYEWVLIQYDWCPCKKRLGHRRTKEKDPMTTRRRRSIYKSRRQRPQKKPPCWQLNLGLLDWDWAILEMASRELPFLRKEVSVTSAMHSVAFCYGSLRKLIEMANIKSLNSFFFFFK